MARCICFARCTLRMKDVIHIDEPMGARFDLALDQIENGLGFEYQGVWIRKEHGVLNCEAVSSTSAESLTETAASALIEHAQSLFDRLQVSSSRFNSLTHDLKMRFCVIEDYGTGTAVIVELVGNELVWSL
jgi:hypothetical protein